MANKVYYGDYTLKHWIDLIIRGNIVLPEYQRSFVWSKEKVIKFANSIKENLFIPPITIGHYSDSGSKMEIIVDGQQRLTSILLLWLNIFPKKTKVNEEKTIDENDDELSDYDEAIEWTIRDIVQVVQKNYDKNEIRNKVLNISKSNQYSDHSFDELMISDSFFDNHCIGYSYLVPEDNNSNYFFAKTFQSINGNFVSLKPKESRKSLYYLFRELKEFFEPSIKIKIKTGNSTKYYNIDFVRYLSLTFQYAKDSKSVAKGYAKRMEDYYQLFIMFAIDCYCNKNVDGIFDKVTEDQRKRVVNLKSEIDKNFPIIGKSIIDLDVFLSGLIFWMIVEGKSVSWDKNGNLIKQLSEKSAIYKENEKHAKNPASIEFLSMRVDASICIYRKFVK